MSPRRFELTVVPVRTQPADPGRYGVVLAEVGAPPGRGFRAKAPARQVARALHDPLADAVRGSGLTAGALSARRAGPLALTEEAGVRLALAILATASSAGADPERARRVVAGIAAMSTEETYYWYARATGLGAPAVRALRLIAGARPRGGAL